jgi:hypothetical protein
LMLIAQSDSLGSSRPVERSSGTRTLTKR